MTMTQEEQEAVEVGSRWRHNKCGSEYVVIGTGRLQATGPLDCEPVVIYRAHDGACWVRPVSEFLDGRFTMLDRLTPSPDATARAEEIAEQIVAEHAVEITGHATHGGAGGTGWFIHVSDAKPAIAAAITASEAGLREKIDRREKELDQAAGMLAMAAGRAQAAEAYGETWKERALEKARDWSAAEAALAEAKGEIERLYKECEDRDEAIFRHIDRANAAEARAESLSARIAVLEEALKGIKRDWTGSGALQLRLGELTAGELRVAKALRDAFMRKIDAALRSEGT